MAAICAAHVGVERPTIPVLGLSGVLFFLVPMRKLLKVIDDLFFLAGAALIVYGLAQIYIPAAWIAAGVFCLAFGALIGYLPGRPA